MNFQPSPGAGSLKEQSAEHVVTSYLKDGDKIIRQVRSSRGVAESEVLSTVPSVHSDRFDYEWLRLAKRPVVNSTAQTMRSIDVFSGCGAMTLGVWEACRALNIDLQPVLAADIDQAALDVFKRNFPTSDSLCGDVSSVLQSEFAAPLSESEFNLKKTYGPIDFLIGGPPCQGHSDLNNHTRRDDPRNALILCMARLAKVFEPSYIIIENVQGARHDRSNSVQNTVSQLSEIGYSCSDGLLLANDFGVAQNRRRFFIVASRNHEVDFNAIQFMKGENSNDFKWACGDLADRNFDDVFNTSSNHSETNKKRIQYLFDHDLYELPNHMRPDCHKNKKHTYNSVYGRMRFDVPSPTITTGFGSTGQGRFVHPLHPRTITPHEAARLQFIPDFFEFGELGRRQLQKLIGNAVPPKLAYVLGLYLLCL